MRRFSEILTGLMGPVIAVLRGLAAALLVLLLLLMTVEVGGRYLFGFSTLIADEFGGYLFAWLTLLGAAYAVQAERHLSMTALIGRLGPRGRNLAAILGALLGLLVSLVCCYASAELWELSLRFNSKSIQTSGVALIWPQLVLPIGFAILALAYLEIVLRRTTQGPPPDDEADGLGAHPLDIA